MTVGRLESCQWSDFESCCGELVEVHEVSSKGFEPAKAQLTRPSQNNSLRMHCRVEEEHRLEVKRLQTGPHLKYLKIVFFFIFDANLNLRFSFLQDFKNGVTVRARVLCPGQSAGGTASCKEQIHSTIFWGRAR